MPAMLLFVLLTALVIASVNPQPQVALKTGMFSLFGLSNVYLMVQVSVPHPYRPCAPHPPGNLPSTPTHAHAHAHAQAHAHSHTRIRPSLPHALPLFPHPAPPQQTDYWGQATELNPFTHTWSLGVEEQFYLVFPLIVWLTGFARQATHGARNLFITVGTISFASLFVFSWYYDRNNGVAYFLMPCRFWEMAAGVLAFLALQRFPRAFERARYADFGIGAAMVGILFCPLQVGGVATQVITTSVVVLLTVAFVCCLRQGTWAYAVLSPSPVVFIGKASYSIYVSLFCAPTTPPSPSFRSSQPPPASRVGWSNLILRSFFGTLHTCDWSNDPPFPFLSFPFLSFPFLNLFHAFHPSNTPPFHNACSFGTTPCSHWASGRWAT